MFSINKYVYISKISLRKYSSNVKNAFKSSLFISGQRAVDTFVVVVPHLDFETKFSNIHVLEENIKKRRLSVNVVEMKQSWDFYKDLNWKKLQMQGNINETSRRVSELLKKEDCNEKKDELEKLERYRTILKQELQLIKKNVWNLEDHVIGKLLNLPNDLHPETPEKQEVLFSYEEERIEKGFQHLDVGMSLNLLELQNEVIYFLKNEAALFEQAVSEMFIDYFTDKDFVRFSNPDFTRSVLAEGVGLGPREFTELFLLENTEANNDHLYLCGGASLFPFCGFHAKQSLPIQSLPVRYIASGRRYSPVTNSIPGLYSVKQSTSVQIFIGTSTQQLLYEEFQSCVENLQNVFRAIGLNFRIVKQPAHKLKNWESLKVSIEVFSTYNNMYIEVGHVGLINDFVSKRLKMCYFDKNESFLNIVSGTIVNTQTLLALCLERSSTDFLIPNTIKHYMLK